MLRVGNVGLTGVTVSDVLLDSLDCAPVLPADIEPGGQVVCTGSYMATEADVEAGSIVNTATADSDQSDPVEAAASVVLQLVPEISLLPDSLDFGAVLVDEGNEIRTLTLENIGNGDTQLDSISEPPAPFALTGGSCLPAPTTVAAGESCTILVAFAPTEIGDFEGAFEIASDAPSSPDAVSLTGRGIVVALPVPVGSPAALAVLVLLLGLSGWLVLLHASRLPGSRT